MHKLPQKEKEQSKVGITITNARTHMRNEHIDPVKSIAAKY